MVSRVARIYSLWGFVVCVLCCFLVCLRRQVCYACVRAEEFRLAGVCGLHILKHPDHVEELIQHYERAGHPTELIQLMEQGLGLEEAHSGVFTELAVLYTKYAPEKLMEHIKIFWSRCNVTKVPYNNVIISQMNEIC